MPPIDWNTYVRSVYPGLVLVGFWYWRHNEVLSNGLFVSYGIAVLISGIFFYALYRGVLYFPIARYIEKWTVGIRQYDFHLKTAKELEAPDKVKTLPMAHAFYANFLGRNAPTEFRNELSRLNALVHVLFMTAFLCIIFCVYDVIAFGFNPPWILVWPLAFFLLFVGGVVFDRWQADLRETIFLEENKDKYTESLRDYICQNEQDDLSNGS